MTTAALGPKSARIYTFPAGGRAGLASAKPQAAPSAGRVPAHPAPVAVDGAWYHEEAIREAERTRR